MHAQAVTGSTAAPEASFTIVGRDAEAVARAGLQRFQQAIQNILDSPLDAACVAKWTQLRAVAARA